MSFSARRTCFFQADLIADLSCPSSSFLSSESEGRIAGSRLVLGYRRLTAHLSRHPEADLDTLIFALGGFVESFSAIQKLEFSQAAEIPHRAVVMQSYGTCLVYVD